MMHNEVTAAEIARFLGADLHGDGALAITKPATLKGIAAGAVVFVKTLSEANLQILQQTPDVLALIPEDADLPGAVRAVVRTASPRLAFARVLAQFFAPAWGDGISPKASIHPTARIGERVVIGDFSVIGPGVVIGDDSEIRNNVTIGRNVRIGKRCVIKSSCVLGEEGFGMEKDEAGQNLRVPHIGSVVLGDDVEIGAVTTVASGTVDPTIIADRVKIDDHVFIAHNVSIGEDTLIIACTEVSGSVVIGRNVWLGPNCTIINGVEIGAGALVGMGAVVTKPVVAKAVVAGNPARVIRMQD